MRAFLENQNLFHLKMLFRLFIFLNFLHLFLLTFVKSHLLLGSLYRFMDLKKLEITHYYKTIIPFFYIFQIINKIKNLIKNFFFKFFNNKKNFLFKIPKILKFISNNQNYIIN
jgi:hypothetical protein